MSQSFAKILSANRGEIACRVIRTARAMGYRTVAVHSPADAGAPHVALADQAVQIGGNLVGESYLKIDLILASYGSDWRPTPMTPPAVRPRRNAETSPVPKTWKTP